MRREDGRRILVVAPTFNIGMAQHHLAFAGTISLRPSTFMAAITDWVRR
jgi:creatinine amidohydrolase